MPKLPILIASEKIDTGRPALANPRDWSAGMDALAHGANRLQHQAGGYAEDAIRQIERDNKEQRRKAEELAKAEQEAAEQVEAIKLQVEFERGLADKDLSLRNAKDHDYLTHDQKLDAAGTELLEEYASKAKLPGAALKVRVNGMRTLKEKVVQAKYEARTQLAGAADAANKEQNARVAVDAADTADPFLREAKLGAQERENLAAANRKHITHEQAGARTRDLREDVDTILARRSMKNDPGAFLLELKDSSNYPRLSATRRQALDEEAVRLYEHQTKQTEVVRKEHSGALKKHLIDRMDSGVNADAEIRALRDSLSDEDYNFVIERNKAIHGGRGGDVQTNHEVYADLELGIRERRITTYGPITAAVKRRELSIPHMTHLYALVDAEKKESQTVHRTEADRTRDTIISANSAFLGDIFKVSGVFDFNQEANATTALALAEYKIRAAKEKDKDPTALANEVLMKYAPMMRQKLMRRRPDGVGAVLMFQDEASLTAAYQSKRLTHDQYLIQKRLFDYWVFLGGLGKPGGVQAGSSGQQKAPEQQSPQLPERNSPPSTGKPFGFGTGMKR